MWQDNIISIRVGSSDPENKKQNKVTLRDLLTAGSNPKGSRTKSQVEQMTSKLLTLCSVLKEKPYVQY